LTTACAPGATQRLTSARCRCRANGNCTTRNRGKSGSSLQRKSPRLTLILQHGRAYFDPYVRQSAQTLTLIRDGLLLEIVPSSKTWTPHLPHPFASGDELIVSDVLATAGLYATRWFGINATIEKRTFVHGCRVAAWMENSADTCPYHRLECEIRAGNFSIMLQ